MQTHTTHHKTSNKNHKLPRHRTMLKLAPCHQINQSKGTSVRMSVHEGKKRSRVVAPEVARVAHAAVAHPLCNVGVEVHPRVRRARGIRPGRALHHGSAKGRRRGPGDQFSAWRRTPGRKILPPEIGGKRHLRHFLT